MIKTSPKTRQTTFRISLPDAESVSLLGDFNNWDKDAHPMKKNKKGEWRVAMKLEEGVYQFRYLVDGEVWRNDDDVPIVQNAFGTDNSVATIRF